MKTKAVLFTLALVLFMSPIPTLANNQGLDWGISLGDKFYMTFTLDFMGEHIEEFVYFNVTSNPSSIPDDVDDISDVLPPSVEVFYDDGSPALDVAVFTMFMGTRIVNPIGNWNLMTSLWEDGTIWLGILETNVDIVVDNWIHWGFSYDYNDGILDVETSVTYLKHDGLIADYHAMVYNATTHELAMDIRMVRDGVTPVLSSPDDILYDEGSTGNTIEWSPTEQSQSLFKVYRDEIEIGMGAWDGPNGQNISINIDGLEPGIYTYELVFFEASGLNVSDLVTVSVQDITAPTISHPSDMSITRGTFGLNITWSAYDSSPASYEIYCNDELIMSGDWNSSDEIFFLSLEGILVGEWNFTIIVRDQGGLFATDDVSVVVVDPILQMSPVILAIGAIIVVAGLVVMIRRR